MNDKEVVKVSCQYGKLTMYRRAACGFWHVRKQINGMRLSISTKTSDVDEAREVALAYVRHKAAEALMDSVPPGADARLAPGRSRRQYSVLDGDYRAMYSSAIKRSAKSGVPFALTEQDMQCLVQRAAGKCEVSGLEFCYATHKHASRAPFAPSLDRIDSRFGYSLANCRIVCVAVNWAMSDWGESVLQRIAFAISARALAQKASHSFTTQIA